MADQQPTKMNALLHPSKDVREATQRVSEVIAQLVPLFMPGTRFTIYARMPGREQMAFLASTEPNVDHLPDMLRHYLRSRAERAEVDLYTHR